MKKKKSLEWGNSLCCGGRFLHDFQFTENSKETGEEICSNCRLRKFFKDYTANRQYLSWHMKQSLRLNKNRFSNI